MTLEKEFLEEAQTFSTSPQTSNRSLELLISYLKQTEKMTEPCLTAMGNISIKCLKQYQLLKKKKENPSHTLSQGEEEKMSLFLASYEESVKVLGEMCKTGQKDLRPHALKALISLLPSQAKVMMTKVGCFPVQHFTEILKNIVLADGVITSLLEVIKEYWSYLDIKTNLWKCLEVLAFELALTNSSVHNILLLIGTLQKPSAESKSEEEPQYFCGLTGAVLSRKHIAAAVVKLWERLMIVDVSPSTKQLLVVTLIEHMMPRMDKPIFLTDYFMSCMNVGGPLSLLGLQGIFVLVQKHNINYPDVYTKIYSLFTPEMFSTPYKSRLYYLADIFLTSTHLPEAMVAGFIKRLARLSLVAPPADIIIIMAFITNLLIRHQDLKKMMHNIHGTDVSRDPFDNEAKEPSESRAVHSSLWEVQLMQRHVLPSVAAAAQFISNPLPSVEHDLGNLLEVNTSDIFMREYKKKMKEPPVSFERPTSLLPPRGESGITLWSLSS